MIRVGETEDYTPIDRGVEGLLATATQLQAAFWDALSDLEGALDGIEIDGTRRSERDDNRRAHGGGRRGRRTRRYAVEQMPAAGILRGLDGAMGMEQSYDFFDREAFDPVWRSRGQSS